MKRIPAVTAIIAHAPGLNEALIAFDDELGRWLDRSDRNLASFEPLAAWQKVCAVMAGTPPREREVQEKQAELQKLIQ